MNPMKGLRLPLLKLLQASQGKSRPIHHRPVSLGWTGIGNCLVWRPSGQDLAIQLPKMQVSSWRLAWLEWPAESNQRLRMGMVAEKKLDSALERRTRCHGYNLPVQMMHPFAFESALVVEVQFRI